MQRRVQMSHKDERLNVKFIVCLIIGNFEEKKTNEKD